MSSTIIPSTTPAPSVSYNCSCNVSSCDNVDNHTFTINMEYIVQTKEIQRTHWKIDANPYQSDDDLYLISLKMERFHKLTGVYAYDIHNSHIVYIPLNTTGLELDHSRSINLVKVRSTIGGLLQFTDSHDEYIPFISNYSCNCVNDPTNKYSTICIHCQIVKRELNRYTLKRAVTIGEFMTYLYSHFESDYGELILRMMNHHDALYDIDPDDVELDENIFIYDDCGDNSDNCDYRGGNNV